ncbi:MAG: hypothetical protein Q4C53_07615 [Clostridia bacterium]|nr:hypothetical protein [Clostridia bacterium]
MAMIADLKEMLLKKAGEAFHVEQRSVGNCKSLKWPALLPMIRYETETYRMEGFGALTVMEGKIIGAIRTMTCMLTPFEGAAVPAVMLDVMEVKEKSTVFIEYFDKTAQGAEMSAFEELSEKYADVETYPDSPVWYNAERAACSLIKISPAQQVGKLVDMTKDFLDNYFPMAQSAEKSAENIPGLTAFSEKMAEGGTAAMEVMKKRFGTDGAKEFYRTVFVPQR